MRRDAGCENDTAAGTLGAQLSGDGLGAEKRACEVDFVRSSPFIGGHLHGMRASDYTCETAQYIDASENLDCAFYSRGNGMLVADVDGLGDDACLGEFGMQFLDAFEGLVGVLVPES